MVHVIYYYPHPKSARARMERKDRIERILVSGALLFFVAFVLSFTLTSI